MAFAVGFEIVHELVCTGCIKTAVLPAEKNGGWSLWQKIAAVVVVAAGSVEPVAV